MSESQCCPSCNVSFDLKQRILIKLQCDHTICRLCSTSQYDQTKQFQCSTCLKVFEEDPNELMKDDQIIQTQYSQQNKGQEQQTEDIESSLSRLKEDIKKTMEDISNQQAFICKEVNQLLNQDLFQTSNLTIQGLSKASSLITEKLNLIQQSSNVITQQKQVTISNQLDQFNDEKSRGNTRVEELKSLGQNIKKALLNLNQQFSNSEQF